ncbi:MAG: enoyl-CoA hydratase/isomerase family protein [Chitinophagales bacterium]
MTMNFNYIEYLTLDRITFITLNRPEKRNAFNEILVEELKQAFTQAEQDEHTKVIILKANGKVFSAGADLGYLQGLQKNSYQENLADSNNLKDLYQQIYTLKKVVIAQVEGHAIAGGCGLATVCDFTFSVPEAKFGYTEVKIGFVPAIVMVFLIRKIGEAKTKELLLTGKLISAAEAKEYGIINNTFIADNINSEVTSFALKLCEEASEQSLQITKEMIAKVQDMNYVQAFDYAAEMNAKGRGTSDCKAGITSFLNKEKINW